MTPNLVPSDRQLRWVSSTTGDPVILTELDRRMLAFYGEATRRAKYQAMLDTLEDAPILPGSVADHLLRDLARCGASTVLEVGCGNGRMYRHLRKYAFTGDYVGLELADGVIRRNRERHPEARWEIGSGYHIPVADGAAGACFGFYVLEHAVYPERMLAEMLRVTAPGDRVYLAFPDFTAAGFLSSQQTGLSPGTTREKIRRGRYWDAAVTLCDSRLRVRPTIRRAAKTFGPFPINTCPLCLDHPELMWPDIDAVYVASKQEVAGWFRGRGCEVEFPCGTTGEFALHAYIRARTPDG